MQFKYLNTIIYIFLIFFYIYKQHNFFHLHLTSFNILALPLRFIVIFSFIYNQYNFTCIQIYFLRTIIWTFVGFVSFCKIDFIVFRKLLFVSGIFTYVLTLLVFIQACKNIPFQNQPLATRQSTILGGNLEWNPLWSVLVCFKPVLSHIRKVQTCKKPNN